MSLPTSGTIRLFSTRFVHSGARRASRSVLAAGLRDVLNAGDLCVGRACEAHSDVIVTIHPAMFAVARQGARLPLLLSEQRRLEPRA